MKVIVNMTSIMKKRMFIMKKNILISLGLAVSIALFGCDSGLDISPSGSVTEDSYWQRDTDAVTAVNAVYAEMDGPTMVKQLDGVTDIGFRALTGPGTLYDVGQGNIETSNGAIEGIWNRYYRGVRKANDVIANIDQVEIGDEELLERVEAEARFLRAYFYTQMSSLWGGVPLITEPIEISEHVGRTGREAVVDFVIDELNGIIASDALPVSYGSSDDVGRATIGAAHALKARVALRNSRWEIARDAAQEVMDLGIYELYPDYGGLFQYEGQDSDEIIFARHYHENGQTYNAFTYSASSIGGNSTVEPIHNLYLKYRLDDTAYDLEAFDSASEAYEDLDPRWDHSVYYTGQPIGNSTYNSHPSSETADRVNLTETSTEHGYNMKKWVDYENDSSNPSNGSINLILIRYADVLLMYAEAKVELNDIDQSVYDALNEIRERPTVDLDPIDGSTHPDQAALRDYIQDERARELAFEGLRLFDMNRWGIGDEKAGLVQGAHFEDENGDVYLQDVNFNKSFSEHHVLWPIPQDEINVNSEITENNDGY